MNNNIKDIIKIHKELDNAVLKGFEKESLINISTYE